MAISINKRQALGFSLPESCNCGSEYCQPVQVGDKIQLQGSLGMSTETNLVTDGDFPNDDWWNLDSGWTIAAHHLVGTTITGSNFATALAELNLIPNRLYVVECAVVVTTPGTGVSGKGWWLKVNGDYMQLPGGLSLGAGYGLSLAAKWLYQPTSVTSDVVQFGVEDDATLEFYVAYIRIREISFPALAFYSGSTQLADITSLSSPNYIKYYVDGTEVSAISTLLEETQDVLFQIYIEGLETLLGSTRGCMVLRVYDQAFQHNQIINGTFDSSIDFWETNQFWAWDAGKASYTPSGAQGEISQTIILQGGSIYSLRFQITDYTGTLNGAFSLVSIEGGTPIVLATYTNNGLKGALIDLTGYNGLIEVEVIFTGLSGTDFKIDGVQIFLTDPDALQVSNCINLQEEFECTLFFEATNNDNAFNFLYAGTGFTHYLRVYSKKKYSNYPEEKEVFTFSDRSKQLLYASAEKEEEVNVGDADEHIHDCLSIMRLHDTFIIDDKTFVASSDYDLKTRKRSDNSQAVFQVRQVQGIGANYSCG